jgi:hypothetical protein
MYIYSHLKSMYVYILVKKVCVYTLPFKKVSAYTSIQKVYIYSHPKSVYNGYAVHILFLFVPLNYIYVRHAMLCCFVYLRTWFSIHLYYVKPDICMHAYSILKNMYKYFISKSKYRNSIPKKYIGIDTPFQKKCIYLQILHSKKYI